MQIARDNDIFAWTNHYAVQRPYTTNGLNQYSAAGGASFLYDPNGNLTSDGSRTYVYDIENRLVSSSTGAALVYDPLGRLFQVSLGGSTTRFLYDGDALVAEYDGATDAMRRRHVHWPGADVPMVTYEGSGLSNVRQLLADHQGSIIAQADAGGAAGAINRYDEYGIPAATNTGRFQYTGQVWLPELGMYHYKARIYSPTLGRFMQTDPIGYEDQFNLYTYVGNDPVNNVDPTGRELRVRGTPDDTKTFLQVTQRATGMPFSVENNRMVVGASLRQNAGLAAITMVNGIQATDSVTLTFVNQSPIIYDAFNLPDRPIDVGDLSAALDHDQNFGAAMLTHVVSERTYAVANQTSYLPAHGYATGQEAAVMGAVGKQESTSASPPWQPVPGDTLTFTYTDANQAPVTSHTLTYDNRLTPR